MLSVADIVAMLAITKFALPHMRRGGAIVNSSSVAAYMVRRSARLRLIEQGNPELFVRSRVLV